MGGPLKLAIVGSGISGLAVAHRLRGQADITLFEAGSYFGGHTHTVDLTLPTPAGLVTHGVDTGFLVFNERTYPQLIQLLVELDVATAKTDMSFSAQIPASTPDQRYVEWSGSTLGSVFAQRSNLWSPRFWGMLRDLLRFNRITTLLALDNHDAALAQPLGEFLDQHRFGSAFRDWYFLPMMGCIWSCPTAQMLQFPVATMVRFCHNHGLLQVLNRPQWWTVTGGARHYVDKITAPIADKRLDSPVQRIERLADGVQITSQTHGFARTERFDKVVLATHSDQALALLAAPSAAEQATLGAIHYHANRAVLHTDASQLPRNPSAWAAWNYERAPATDTESSRVCLHYWLNKLQPLPWSQPVVVSLNPIRDIARTHVMGTYDYAHPVLDLAAIAAQKRMPALQGQQHTYFCGAWMGYGFHEDGLKAGLAVAELLKGAA
ncbi:Predicted NAD/FAD-binding protein [Rhodoferax sp. OV413]|uniref:NAD(P)/FAD-dependent oxidoreductase n=1 Tax=Rhodoferax sp. OV413 TaxID=1855285 RepID=UPI00088B1756|nr:FAD-dependent oxidoreductase [Rhodoferax sp. OV413]SDO73993.1 Predicted NAD/FAD-binding protein [Rhodoferax sp. OV413]